MITAKHETPHLAPQSPFLVVWFIREEANKLRTTHEAAVFCRFQLAAP